jgi:hypothetical protein
MGRITDEPITAQILIDLGYKDDGLFQHESQIMTNGEQILIEAYDKTTNVFVWVDDLTGKVYKTIEDLMD